MSILDSAMNYRGPEPNPRAYDNALTPVARRAVVIESPFKDEPMALHYLGECVKDSISRNEAPIASHGFYTRWLDDTDPNQRTQGIDCQLALIRATKTAIFYTDLGISKGMQEALQYCNRHSIPIEFRELGPDWRKNIPVGKTQPPVGPSLGSSGGQLLGAPKPAGGSK